MRIIYTIFFALSFLIISFSPNNLHAKSKNNPLNSKSFSKEPALIEADIMKYDAEKEIVTAEGNVEVVQGERILIADSLTYDKMNDIVTASGNISLREPGGTVMFADSVKLRDELKKGVVENFSARFVDSSVMAAKEAKRVDENTSIIKKAVYSPCPVCKEQPEKPPLWQVASNEATIDSKEQRVVYNNAFFEVYGIPLLYTPYFSHPTPDADRKSGFLTPKYSHDQVFGTTIKTPYYYNISPNMDATITPSITANEGPVLSGEFRHLLKSGKYKLKGSITNPDRVDASGNTTSGKDVRGHIEGEGEFSINDNWGWGFRGKRASDDTYLKKYHFGEEDVLTSDVYVNRIKKHDYVFVNAITFQGLNATDDPGQTPLILPYIETHTERNFGTIGTKAFFDSNMLMLTRDEGVSSKRLSLKGGLSQPYITKSGNVFVAGLTLRGDAYFVDNVADSTNSNNTLDGFKGRVLPEADLKWSLPMIKTVPERSYLIEPITKFIISPNGGNPDKIPDEDSQDIEFSAENLFDNNHFTGYDRVESGTRVNYGLRAGVSDYNYGDVNLLFGQTYRAKRNPDFDRKSGLWDNLSDYVGKINYSKNEIFDIAYKFRFDKDSFSVRNNTVSGTVDYKPVKFTMDYVAINDNEIEGTSTDSRENLIAGADLDITKSWKLTTYGNRNIETGEWISTKAGILYKGACVDFSLEWLKEFTRDRDIEPSTTISFQVSLKNMGQD